MDFEKAILPKRLELEVQKLMDYDWLFKQKKPPKSIGMRKDQGDQQPL
jgi:hypothetical protein